MTGNLKDFSAEGVEIMFREFSLITSGGFGFFDGFDGGDFIEVNIESRPKWRTFHRNINVNAERLEGVKHSVKSNMRRNGFIDIFDNGFAGRKTYKIVGENPISRITLVYWIHVH